MELPPLNFEDVSNPKLLEGVFENSYCPKSNKQTVAEFLSKTGEIQWTYTVAAPLQAAATIQKLHFWPSNCHIKSTKKTIFSLKT